MIIETLIYNMFKIFIAYLLGDFMMGVYHWIKDTYFTPFTPIIGKKFIWGSRLHHVRPRYILEFSDLDIFIESSLWTLSWMLPLFLFVGPNIFLVTLFLTIGINDIVHKYAHAYDSERPLWATFLQKIGIFQSHDEHHKHHIYPNEINYCPISPYLNAPLEYIHFWKKLEQYIESITGIKPRAQEIEFEEDPEYPAGIKFINLNI